MISIGRYNIYVIPVQHTVEKSDYKLFLSDGEIIYMHYDGSIYTIKKAYELNIINSGDVYNIGVAIGVDIMNDAVP